MAEQEIKERMSSTPWSVTATGEIVDRYGDIVAEATSQSFWLTDAARIVEAVNARHLEEGDGEE